MKLAETRRMPLGNAWIKRSDTAEAISEILGNILRLALFTAIDVPALLDSHEVAKWPFSRIHSSPDPALAWKGLNDSLRDLLPQAWSLGKVKRNQVASGGHRRQHRKPGSQRRP